MGYNPIRLEVTLEPLTPIHITSKIIQTAFIREESGYIFIFDSLTISREIAKKYGAKIFEIEEIGGILRNTINSLPQEKAALKIHIYTQEIPADGSIYILPRSANQPYIPGSSLKGALLTLYLLSFWPEKRKNAQKYWKNHLGKHIIFSDFIPVKMKAGLIPIRRGPYTFREAFLPGSLLKGFIVFEVDTPTFEKFFESVKKGSESLMVNCKKYGDIPPKTYVGDNEILLKVGQGGCYSKCVDLGRCKKRCNPKTKYSTEWGVMGWVKMRILRKKIL